MLQKRFIHTLSFVTILLSLLACNLGQSISSGNPSETGSSDSPAGNPAGDASAGSGACANLLYPVKAGATWTYQFSDSTLGGFTRSINSVSAEGFKDQDVFTKGITRTGEWKCNAGALTALQPDSGPTASVQNASVQADFKTTSMDGVTLPAAVKAGDTWSQNFVLEGIETIHTLQIKARNATALSCTAGGTESVTVKAGTFNAVRADCKTDITITMTMNGSDVPTRISTTSTSWYAPAVGLVKTDSLLNNTHITMELTAYHIP